MPFASTHPLVLAVWSVAVGTAALFGWLGLSNLLSYRLSRRRESLLFGAFSLAGCVQALVVAAAFLDTSPELKSQVFRAMWVIGMVAMSLWIRAVMAYYRDREPWLEHLSRALLVMGAVPLLDMVVFGLSQRSIWFVLAPRETRSVVFMASGNVHQHTAVADIFGLMFVLCVVVAAVGLLRFSRRQDTRDGWIQVGVVLTAAAAVAETLLAGTDSPFTVPLFFAANLVEACRITWVDQQCLARELERVRQTQTDQTALIDHQLSQLALAERMAKLGENTAFITHDLRNPLTTVRIGVDSAREVLAEPEADVREAEELLAFATAGLDHALELVNRMTRQAKDEASTPMRATMVEPVLRDAVTLCRGHLEGIDVHIDADPNATVHGHATELTQVIVNLVSNAADAVSELEDPWIRLLVRRRDELVEIRCVDAGARPGPEVLDRMFQPRFTTRGDERGTGLGLAICRRIVLAHGGRIDVDRGAPNTTLVVSLPARGNALPEREQSDDRAG